MEAQTEVIFAFYDNNSPNRRPVSKPHRVLVSVSGAMLKITESIDFMAGQASLVVAIEETASAIIAHLFDVDGELRHHCLGALVYRRDRKYTPEGVSDSLMLNLSRAVQHARTAL